MSVGSNFGFSGGGSGGGGGTVIRGGGTLNQIAKFTPDGTHVGNSLLFDNGVSVGLGTVTPSASAILDIQSTSQGLLTPRMTQTQRNAIIAPALSLFIFNTTSGKFNFWDGIAWEEIESAIPPTGLTLSQVLGNGNTTGGMPIIMTSGDTLNFSVGSGGSLNSLATTAARKWDLPDASGTISLTSDISSSAWLQNGNSNGALKYIGTNDAYDFPIYTNGVEVARFSYTNGYLGIGTPSPASKLEVSANDISAAIISTRYQTNNNAPSGFLARKANGTYLAPTGVLSGDEIGGIGIAGYNSVGAFNSFLTGEIIFYAAEDYSATAGGTNLKIQLAPISSNIMTTVATILNNGNMGIGITTPTARLQVQGATTDATAYSLIAQDSVTNSLLSVRNDGQILLQNIITAGLGGGANYTNTTFGSSALFSNTSGYECTAIGYQALFSNTTALDNTAIGFQALRSNTVGTYNVGIGVQSLYNNLNGTANVGIGEYALYENSSGSYNIVVGYGSGRGIVSGSGNAIFGSQITGLSSTLNNTLILANGNGDIRIYTDNLGNTGLGTTTPLATIHIFGYGAGTINQRLEPVLGVQKDTTGGQVITISITPTAAQTIAIPVGVFGIKSKITYIKTAGAGLPTIGQGTMLELTTSVQNIGGTLTLDTIQNDYTGTINAIVGVSVTYVISGTNLIVQVTGTTDTIQWNVITETFNN